MLNIRRKPGQWVEVTHRSGDKMFIRLVRDPITRALTLCFDDPPRNFEIARPERVRVGSPRD